MEASSHAATSTSDYGESSGLATAALSALPLAIGILDSEGRFVERFGAHRDVLRTQIPSMDSSQQQLWRVFDETGSELPVSQWPGRRALKGEAVRSGIRAAYALPDRPTRWFNLVCVPFATSAFSGGIALLHDLDRNHQRIDEDSVIPDRLVEEIAARLRAALGYVPPSQVPCDEFANLPFVANPAEAGLSERERTTLTRIAWGQTHKEVAAALGISVKTVNFHQHRGMTKLGLKTRRDLIQHAAGSGWFQQPSPDS